MKCPNCDFIDKDEAFGDPATCPECGAIYEKALKLKQFKQELEAQKAANATQQSAPVKKVLKEAAPGAPESKEEESSVDKWLWVVLLVLGFAVFFSAVDSYRGYAERAADPETTLERARQAEEKRKTDERRQVEENRKADEKRQADNDDMRRIKMQRMAREGIKSKLYDPDTAKFRNQRGACGEVNSKNLFGGYTGYKRFMYGGGELILIEDDPAFAEGAFDENWELWCAEGGKLTF